MPKITTAPTIAPTVLINGEKESIYRLNRLREVIASNRLSGSTYVNHAARGVSATTYGQVTNLDYSLNEEENYSSWIRQALEVGYPTKNLIFDRAFHPEHH